MFVLLFMFLSFVFQFEKVLQQGDISEVAEPYATENYKVGDNHQ